MAVGRELRTYEEVLSTWESGRQVFLAGLQQAAIEAQERRKREQDELRLKIATERIQAQAAIDAERIKQEAAIERQRLRNERKMAGKVIAGECKKLPGTRKRLRSRRKSFSQSRKCSRSIGKIRKDR